MSERYLEFVLAYIKAAVQHFSWESFIYEKYELISSPSNIWQAVLDYMVPMIRNDHKPIH